MKLMGIDYGKKRVGVALSDEGGRMAFPYKVINGGTSSFLEILEICKTEGVLRVVIGESKTLSGKDNPLMKDINKIKDSLEENKLDVYLEPEFFTTAEAERIQGDNDKTDASAATLILQSYIDKAVNKSGDTKDLI